MGPGGWVQLQTGQGELASSDPETSQIGGMPVPDRDQWDLSEVWHSTAFELGSLGLCGGEGREWAGQGATGSAARGWICCLSGYLRRVWVHARQASNSALLIAQRKSGHHPGRISVLTCFTDNCQGPSWPEKVWVVPLKTGLAQSQGQAHFPGFAEGEIG